ncbi:hypothetical protein [Methanolobus psychrotolerans]|uniref:hypothetical protein n=1 Tax=Methanolobus psychrotolerans TaxID=1874706 RepID=UPI000B915CAB|nr:hypothetical protein [Methanolobus psychrotolerans]
MSSEISSLPSDHILCPYCGSINQPSPVPSFTPGKVDYEMYGCRTCKLPIVVESKVEIVRIPRRVEGVEQIQCADCGGLFAGHEVKYIDHAFHCRSCLEECTHGTHPDDEQFLCSGCGTLHSTTDGTLSEDGGKICKGCFEIELEERERNKGLQKCGSCKEMIPRKQIVFRDGYLLCPACLSEREQSTKSCEQIPTSDEQDSYVDEQTPVKEEETLQSDEQNEQYINLPGSKTVSYRIDGDSVSLRYKSNDCNTYTFDVIWDIVDSTPSNWMKRIDNMLKAEQNCIQKASALNQLCKAINLGTVKLPGCDA